MKRGLEKILASKFWWLLLPAILFVINYFASVLHSRIDLTKEKRYTLSSATKNILRDIDSTLDIDIFLGGNNLPPDVHRLKNTINEFLIDCKDYNRSNLRFRFVNPYEGLSGSEQKKLEDSLKYYYKLLPSILGAPEKAGDKLEIIKIIHGAVIKYKGKKVGIDFLK